MRSSGRKSLKSRLGAIRLVVLDVDGVLTDGTIVYDNRGNEFRGFHVHDGFGITRARRHGLRIAIATGKTSAAVARRARDLQINDVYQGLRDKVAVVRALEKKYRLRRDEVCCIADDVHDIPFLQAAGLSAAPADAIDEVRRAVDLVSDLPGGRGAVRDVLDRILKAKGLLRQ